MKKAPRWGSLFAAALAVGSVAAYAQDPAHATELRMAHPGPGPDGKDRISFLTHRLGSDHAEAISVIDMNGDGFDDLLSGAYWYENPGRMAAIGSGTSFDRSAFITSLCRTAASGRSMWTMTVCWTW